MAGLAPLAMSQTKDELLGHLNMGTETYIMMAVSYLAFARSPSLSAIINLDVKDHKCLLMTLPFQKEADRYYQWLTTDKYHLKENCKRKPPYDWSDINEKSKDEAMKLIAESGNAQTSYYWNLAGPSPDECPNWIARWFLYHKFRYRDGRNRNMPSNGDSGKSPSQHSSHQRPHHQHSASASSSTSSAYYDTQAYGSMTSESSSSGYENDYGSYDTRTSSHTQVQQGHKQHDGKRTKSYYDPVRDVER
ncbi:hypothetical protein LOCC1_G002735 [Lachnellula occidentalis]|uniref:Uncharacterized protein n=1 Tax=Lachnellula occidentalis TaxID=215460 RepID=A0A8H8UJW9_9HELO|nr:hypothetical protein LOCC1_G002735 [Lachnellula occidentalis]